VVQEQLWYICTFDKMINKVEIKDLIVTTCPQKVVSTRYLYTFDKFMF
jgi:hypothetical protein